MKGEFNHYNASSIGSRAMTEPAMRVAKCGLISFNKLAVNKIGLKAGDQVSFHQSKGRPREWFIEKVKENGIATRAYKEASSLSCSAIAKAIMSSLNLKKGFTVRIGSETDDDGWWSLITSAINN